MKQVKIFSKSSLSDLERALNGYLNTLDHSNILRNITYNLPTEKSKLWTAVVEVDLYGGKPVFWSANKKELEDVRVILNIYRFNKLAGMVYSVINFKKSLS